ncbi:MAG: hypothetical protein F6K17_08530 [Okeania sp. SIO3C4]|nr:hypothetical protein [Okeania sp. SIO3B3]NER02669.1 hypothetical protein [Okeania sp. SIO3C4]
MSLYIQDLRRTTISSRGTCEVCEANGRSPLQVVYDFIFCVISCSVEYLHSGGRKALMLKAEGRREERVKRDKVFL